MNIKKLAVVLLIAILVAGFFVFDLGQYFTLDYFKSQRHTLRAGIHMTYHDFRNLSDHELA